DLFCHQKPRGRFDGSARDPRRHPSTAIGGWSDITMGGSSYSIKVRAGERRGRERARLSLRTWRRLFLRNDGHTDQRLAEHDEVVRIVVFTVGDLSDDFPLQRSGIPPRSVELHRADADGPQIVPNDGLPDRSRSTD